jgi:hypothetical protein
MPRRPLCCLTRGDPGETAAAGARPSFHQYHRLTVHFDSASAPTATHNNTTLWNPLIRPFTTVVLANSWSTSRVETGCHGPARHTPWLHKRTSATDRNYCIPLKPHHKTRLLDRPTSCGTFHLDTNNSPSVATARAQYAAEALDHPLCMAMNDLRKQTSPEFNGTLYELGILGNSDSI